MVKYKESDSESEDDERAVDAGERFRVRVCMQRLFGAGDVRARAFVSVAPRRRVRWLQRRLRRLFHLPRVCLLSRGHLLPPQEPLALLQPDDPVEVVPADAEPEDSSAARDLVDSVGEVRVAPVNESERSSQPVSPDDLTETKRQALLMLEQYCAESAVECVTESAAGVPRARRRRVRRRRRAAPACVVSAPPPPRPDAPAQVLRDALRPRAPRVVRPLAVRESASPLETPPPAEIVTG